MRVVGVVAIITIIIILLCEVLISLRRQVWRKRTFFAAKMRASHTKRPLIVIGDPAKGMGSRMLGPAYGFGDLCIDIDPISPAVVQGDFTDILKTHQNDSAIVFISCVLEYMPNIEDGIATAKRVAGGMENLFIVGVEWYSITAYVYNDRNDRARNVLLKYPPFHNTITYFSF